VLQKNYNPLTFKPDYKALTSLDVLPKSKWFLTRIVIVIAPATATWLTKAYVASLQILINRAFGTSRIPTSFSKLKVAARAKSPAYQYTN
jgi:hypothetical protein